MAPSSFELILVGFILLLPFLYETSRTFRYYFKFMVYYGIVTFAATILIPIFLLRPKSLKNLVLVLFFVYKRDTFFFISFFIIFLYFVLFLFFSFLFFWNEFIPRVTFSLLTFIRQI